MSEAADVPAASDTPTAPDADTAAEGHEPRPIGSLVLLSLFLVMIAAMWIWAYWILIDRS